MNMPNALAAAAMAASGNTAGAASQIAGACGAQGDARKSLAEILEAILRSTPRDQIPCAVPFGCLTLGLVSPGDNFDAPFDPLKNLLGIGSLTEYLAATQPESGGSISASLSASAGFRHRVAVLRFFYQCQTQFGAAGALETVTYAPSDRNRSIDHLVFTGGGPTLVDTATTDATNNFRLTVPAGQAGGAYITSLSDRPGCRRRFR